MCSCWAFTPLSQEAFLTQVSGGNFFHHFEGTIVGCIFVLAGLIGYKLFSKATRASSPIFDVKKIFREDLSKRKNEISNWKLQSLWYPQRVGTLITEFLDKENRPKISFSPWAHGSPKKTSFSTSLGWLRKWSRSRSGILLRFWSEKSMIRKTVVNHVRELKGWGGSVMVY